LVQVGRIAEKGSQAAIPNFPPDCLPQAAIHKMMKEKWPK
jgi:hypothetical protein